jgi:CheY-like chemotaxis protein
MPIGIEVSASLHHLCRPWIVAMTASVFTEDRQQCKDAGMDDFLVS